jgi:hypothetical protein
MQQKTFRNFQIGDAIRTTTGEVFEIIERLTYYCKSCNCKPLTPCDEFKQKTTLVIKSQRGIWEMSLKTLTDKYLNGEINEVTYVKGQWK